MRRRGKPRGGNKVGLAGRAGRFGGRVWPSSVIYLARHAATICRVAFAFLYGSAVSSAATIEDDNVN